MQVGLGWVGLDWVRTVSFSHGLSCKSDGLDWIGFYKGVNYRFR